MTIANGGDLVLHIEQWGDPVRVVQIAISVMPFYITIMDPSGVKSASMPGFSLIIWMTIARETQMRHYLNNIMKCFLRFLNDEERGENIPLWSRFHSDQSDWFLKNQHTVE